MLYFNNVVRFRKWKVFLILGLFSLALGLKVVLKTLRVTAAQLTDLRKCPACYGLSICGAILNNEIVIRHRGVYATFANLFNAKNVFFGNYAGEKVVLKKLAHTSELYAFDKMLCTDSKLFELCPNNSNKKSVPRAIDFYTQITRELTTDFASDNTSNLRLCPITDHMDDLLYNVYANSGNDKKQISHAYLWTILRINPEPVVLQILPTEDGWPVPKYYGACGRVIVEEYVGPPLSNYHQEPWIRRAKIASSLLEAAQKFTYRSPHFGFYLTDISPDNIAVDPKDNAKFIDMENIIVVDKRIQQNNRTSDWEELEVNKVDFTCQNCLAFSPVDICSHHFSDHNYYAVCQHLLSRTTSSNAIPGGLLHDIPNDILQQYPNLPTLIEQCAIPSAAHTRIVVGDLLREVLNEIVLENTRQILRH
ncbi:divergent protein kinase domain 2A isoform X2 [Neodiprion lecontei]|uniref:Divergent protein kinase domain 2A isoform X2 n=1 Tax=Neodiprion lecontei TaxID=441921 RepID=A0A6J0B6T7_NEOLC|nr:divergent protein kinase domain 2A isoform X2 [Neodiprion lecontei]